ncbi:MAG: LuxR C-terminal-related transcriptional regulator [Bacteroidota bacterium]
MEFQDILYKLKNSLEFSVHQRSIEQVIESYRDYPLQENEFIYIVSIPACMIVFQKGLEKMGFPSYSEDIHLEGGFAYRFIYQEDYEEVFRISEEVLAPDHIHQFAHKMLHTEYRAEKVDKTLVRLHRDCKIIAFDPVSQAPIAYFTSFRIFEKSADLDMGVRFEVFPSDENSSEFFQDLEESHHKWKFSNTSLSLRELEVFNLFNKGYSSSKEIASKLGIKKSTVDVYFRKAKQHAQGEDPSIQTKMDVLNYVKSKGYLDILRTLGKPK